MRRRTHLAALLALTACSAEAHAEGTWELLESSSFGSRYDDLHFIDPDVGWAVNAQGEIWHTQDGGDTWALQYSETFVYMRSVGFANAQRGWAGTLSSEKPLLQTDDGGQTWSPVENLPDPPPTGICGIQVLSADVMVATGIYAGPAYFLKTTDGGATWTGHQFPPTTAVGLIDVRFTSPNDGILVGGVGADLFAGNALVLATGDGGETWEERFVGTLSSSWCWKITFPAPAIGYVSVERLSGPHFFLKTIDGGETWTEELFVNGERSQGIGFVTENLGWIGSSQGINGAYVTTDGGVTWSPDAFGLELNRFQFFGTTLGYAGGDYLYRYTDAPVGTADASPGPALRARSHPNPFRPMTTIAFTLPHAGGVRVHVHDPGGRLVRTLLDDRVPAGEHQITWDGKDDAGDDVAAGVYLYVIHSEALNAIGKLVRVD